MARSFSMVDVGEKAATRRRAAARGSLRMGAAAFALLKDGLLPKGDALKLGEAAGIMAAKRTPQNVPLCHPLPLDQVVVRFELDSALPGVHAFCEASAFAKTGVEMEALSGVAGALLSVYDLVKQVDPALTLSDIRLETKEGGKSGPWRHPQSAPPSAQRPKAAERHRASLGRAAVVTVSDRCSSGKAKDLSGPILREGLAAVGFRCGAPTVIPDDKALISLTIVRLAKTHDVVVLTGGTGLAPRDVTPEAVEAVCDRLIPGVGEALRRAGTAATPLSSLSRCVAGQRGRALVVALPGSRGGAADGVRVLAELLPHAVHVARGGDHSA